MEHYVAYFYAMTGHALVSYGNMFNRLVLKSWTLEEIINECEGRCERMDTVGIPHHAYTICHNGEPMIPVIPRKNTPPERRQAIRNSWDTGLVYHVQHVWSPEQEAHYEKLFTA